MLSGSERGAKSSISTELNIKQFSVSGSSVPQTRFRSLPLSRMKAAVESGSEPLPPEDNGTENLQV